MKISQSNLIHACSRAGLDDESANKIWNELKKENSSKFNLENLAYYFGALIIMSAMAWFITDAWDSLGGLGISFLGILYFFLFFFAGRYFWFSKKLRIPGGLLVTISISMISIIVFGIEKYTNLWPQDAQANFHDYHLWLRGSWIIIEIATIIAGLITLKFIRFPFLSFPIAFSLWYLSMDLAPILKGTSTFSWEEKQLVSTYFGLAMLLVSYFIDKRTKDDFAFWGYLFGMFAFWGGLSSMSTDNELNRFLYFLTNAFLVFISVIIQRRVFIIFGSIGVSLYFGYLAFEVFKDSLLFPIALSLLGVSVIYLGIVYSKNKDKIEQKITDSLPDFLLKLNPECRKK